MIYPAKREEIDLLLEIERASFMQEQLTREQFRFYLSRSKRAKIFSIYAPVQHCIRSGIILCGYFIIKPLADCIRIFSIAIDWDYREKGIGTHALKFIELYAVEHCKKKVKLEVRMDSKAINFYHKNGYKHVGNLYKYYSDGMDAAIMEKDLTQCPMASE